MEENVLGGKCGWGRMWRYRGRKLAGHRKEGKRSTSHLCLLGSVAMGCDAHFQAEGIVW